jgi:hypothetical protein
MQILFSFCRKCVIRHFIEVYKMIEHISMDIPQNISKYTFEDPTCYHKYKPIPYDCSLYIVWSISTDSINYLSLIIIYVLFNSKTNKAQSASRRYELDSYIFIAQHCPITIICNLYLECLSSYLRNRFQLLAIFGRKYLFSMVKFVMYKLLDNACLSDCTLS